MSTRIEDELRATLHERAADITPDAISRLTAVDYRPQRRFKRPALALTGTTALAGATGAAIALLSSASPAFAGWTAAPTQPTAGQQQQANDNCRAQIEQAQMPLTGLSLQLSDTRGPFTFEIYANDLTTVNCTTGPSFTGVSDVTTSAPITTPADQLGAMDEHATNRGGDAFTFMLGRAGANVTGATLNLADGTHVQVTIQNGWFVAWWPGTIAAQSATLDTTGGSKTQAFPAPKCPLQVCAGGTNTSTSGTGTTTSGTTTSGTSTGPGAVVSYGSAGGSGSARGSYSFNGQSVK